MSEYIVKNANVVASEYGELRMSRVGLSLTFRDQSYAIDSEMLEPPRSVAVYFKSSPAADAQNAPEIRSFIAGALASLGFSVEFI